MSDAKADKSSQSRTDQQSDSAQDLPEKQVTSSDAESVKGGLGTIGKHLA